MFSRGRGIRNDRIQQVDIFTSLDKMKKKYGGMSQIYHDKSSESNQT